MQETCKLAATGLYWSGDIPSICAKSCYETWEGAINGPVDSVDIFSTECDASEVCNHDLDNGGTALQRLDGPKRVISLLSICALTGTEQFAEEYTFECINDGQAPSSYPVDGDSLF